MKIKKMFGKVKKVVCSIPSKVSKCQLAAFLFLATIMSSFAEGETVAEPAYNFITKGADGSMAVNLKPILDTIETSLLYALGAGAGIFIIWMLFQLVTKALRKFI